MNILALSPHTDDAELGAGGSLARFVEEGHQVNVVAFSTGNPVDGSNVEELALAMAALGIEQWDVYKYPCRHYQKHRARILEDLETLRANFDPDLVLCTSRHDTHQDHVTLALEVGRAFKHTSILAYEMPHNCVRPFGARFYVPLEERHIKTKTVVLGCYKSQQHRHYTRPEVAKSLARVRGLQIDTEYAEAFEVVRWIV